MKTISTKELKSRLLEDKPDNEDKERGCALLDVRDRDKFLREHIPGAIQSTFNDLANFRKRFSQEKEIILYGEEEESASVNKAAEILSDAGFAAVLKLSGGFLEWKKEQDAVEEGSGDIDIAIAG
jgi:rhodanese-related sulfurtransferase